MNIKEIKELLELMAEHGVGEIEIEKDNAKIKLRKMATGGIVMQSAPQMMAPMPTAAQIQAHALAAAAPAAFCLVRRGACRERRVWRRLGPLHRPHDAP